MWILTYSADRTAPSPSYSTDLESRRLVVHGPTGCELFRYLCMYRYPERLPALRNNFVCHSLYLYMHVEEYFILSMVYVFCFISLQWEGISVVRSPCTNAAQETPIMLCCNLRKWLKAWMLILWRTSRSCLWSIKVSYFSTTAYPIAGMIVTPSQVW